MRSVERGRLPPAILLMGPTASGKTQLAVELARRLPVDILSVDSAQVYRGMDIGTAKPGPEILAVAPHRLIDICDPTESYSAACFRRDASREMTSIVGAGRIPLLVGGTMLYFRAIQQGLAILPEADPALRARLSREAQREGWAALHGRLVAKDPETARRIHPNDPQRIQRALEVCELTGRPMSELLRAGAGRGGLAYRLVKLVRTPADRGMLYARIEQRFRDMLARGFEQEVRTLWSRGDLTPDLPSMRCVGYRQLLKYLLGEHSFDEAVATGIRATRQLAKRQLTWLRAEADCTWIHDEGQSAGLALRVLRDAGL